MRRLVRVLFMLLILTIPVVGQAQATCGLPPRLHAGGQGYVLIGNVMRVRSLPSTAGEQLGEIHGGTFFDVEDGFVCAENYTWWQVRRGTLTGWMVESSADEYFAEPTEQTGNARALAWSPDNRWLAVGTTAGSWLFDANAFDIAPRQVGRSANDLAFRSVGELVIAMPMTPAEIYGLSIYDPVSGQLIEQMLTGWEGESAPPPDPSYQMLAYATDTPWYAYRQGRWIAVTNDQQTLMLSQIEDGSQAVDLVFRTRASAALVLYATTSGGRVGIHQISNPRGDRDLMRPLAFDIDATSIAVSPEGSQLAVGGADGRVLIADWAIPENSRSMETESAIQRLAFAPDGRTLAVATESQLLLCDTETLEVKNILTEGTLSIDIAYSPDGLLLAQLTASTVQVFDVSRADSVLFHTFE